MYALSQEKKADRRKHWRRGSDVPLSSVFLLLICCHLHPRLLPSPTSWSRPPKPGSGVLRAQVWGGGGRVSNLHLKYLQLWSINCVILSNSSLLPLSWSSLQHEHAYLSPNALYQKRCKDHKRRCRQNFFNCILGNKVKKGGLFWSHVGLRQKKSSRGGVTFIVSLEWPWRCPWGPRNPILASHLPGRLLWWPSKPKVSTIPLEWKAWVSYHV